MENTLSDAIPASTPAPAEPSWFSALIAPASAPPEPEPDAPSPVEAVEPGPVAEAPTDDAAPPPEPETQPTVSPEVEALRRQVAEMQQEQARRDREAEQQRLQTERTQSRAEYWAEVKRNVAQIEDPEERDAYWQRASDELVVQEERARNEVDQQSQLVAAVKGFPDYARTQYNITDDQFQYLVRIATGEGSPESIGYQMSGAVDWFVQQNATAAKPTVSPETTREAVQQTIAERAAEDARTSGVAALGGINGANPAPPSLPTNLRPGTPESLGALAGILQAL